MKKFGILDGTKHTHENFDILHFRVCLVPHFAQKFWILVYHFVELN
jgi:hypothetical protein